MKCEWEEIATSGDKSITKRLKIIGGWIVLNNTYSVGYFDDKNQSESMVFIADYNHEWDIT